MNINSALQDISPNYMNIFQNYDVIYEGSLGSDNNIAISETCPIHLEIHSV